MIGPVSEVGKTMLSSLQGAMAKGMPVDQAIQYVKSQAATGVAPLVDLYALLKQFERLKQPPAQPLMGGNLKQQLDNIESTAVRSPGGITGQPMPAAPASPMGGLASLDAGRMENPQGFNMGGIVAFAEGGQPEKPKSITPELYTSPKLPTSLEDLARQAAAEEAALKTPEGRAAFLAQRDAEMKEAGLGKYAKSIELRDKMAEDAAKRAELLPGEEAALNEQEYWDAVAATDQPDLISAMAKAKAGTTARKRASIQRVNAAKDKAAEEEPCVKKPVKHWLAVMWRLSKPRKKRQKLSRRLLLKITLLKLRRTRMQNLPHKEHKTWQGLIKAKAMSFWANSEERQKR